MKSTQEELEIFATAIAQSVKEHTSKFHIIIIGLFIINTVLLFMIMNSQNRIYTPEECKQHHSQESGSVEVDLNQLD